MSQSSAVAVPRVIDETDEYTSAVAGARVDAVRMGDGSAPNLVLGIPDDRVTVTSSRIGFPITTNASIDEGRIVATVMRDVPCDSRWCGIPLRTGSVIVYGPGAEHAAINRPGLWFTFAITDLAQVRERADRLGVDVTLPAHAGVVEHDPSARTGAFEAALATHVHLAQAGRLNDRSHDDVLDAMVAVLASEDARSLERGRGIDSRDIVHSCIEFAEDIERIPSIGELCLAAHVSERRLRDAFVEEFDSPPSRWFRAWALDRVHRRLRSAEADEVTVTEVACRLGFDHLGRFAGHYQQLFGECPSETLHAQPA